MTTLVNIHPADELAAIREEIKQLQGREASLRAALIADPEHRDGNQYTAVVVLSTRESIDKEAIVAALGRAVIEPFIKATKVTTLKTVHKEEHVDDAL